MVNWQSPETMEAEFCNYLSYLPACASLAQYLPIRSGRRQAVPRDEWYIHVCILVTLTMEPMNQLTQYTPSSDGNGSLIWPLTTNLLSILKSSGCL